MKVIIFKGKSKNLVGELGNTGNFFCLIKEIIFLRYNFFVCFLFLSLKHCIIVYILTNIDKFPR